MIDPKQVYASWTKTPKGGASVKEIPLTRGLVAVVDDEDYEELRKFNWYASPNGRQAFYAIRESKGETGKRHNIWMHRVIAGTPDGMDTDHINGDSLDNRRENLRVCTRTQNNANSHTPRRHSSRFKGVTWDDLHQKWRAQIGYERKQLYIGIFDSEVEAAQAYDAKARELFGEFAKLNFLEA